MLATKFKNNVRLEEDTPEEFLTSVLGNEISLIERKNYQLARGMMVSHLDIVTDSISQFPDDKAYLHFCPTGEEEFYMTINFFPEINPKENVEIFRVTRLVFTPAFFDQWGYDVLSKKQPFKFDYSSEQAIALPPCCFEPINNLTKVTQEKLNDFSFILQWKESAIFLLRISLDAFLNTDEACKLPACSFLSNTKERDKVMHAWQIIMDHLDSPKTIRELSRMVGMNECYLKKGFKATFGKTIHEFQRYERIEKAKELLREGTYTVNEVAFKMGFGSASHFSSSFKKVAGINPCQLLS